VAYLVAAQVATVFWAASFQSWWPHAMSPCSAGRAQKYTDPGDAGEGLGGANNVFYQEGNAARERAKGSSIDADRAGTRKSNTSKVMGELQVEKRGLNHRGGYE
jgi:hypothetical protein